MDEKETYGCAAKSKHPPVTSPKADMQCEFEETPKNGTP
jgi:hypothetical protein